jgi:hypothetical protein
MTQEIFERVVADLVAQRWLVAPATSVASAYGSR